ncbi:MAG: LysR family transcriptional regulator [Solirubrobacteraceae bacterium]|nr:LysR family transcriptional regulator [Solirubrobacteraceae bacterium]
MLDLRRLRTLREVLDRRSFSAAASALDYTQSSVSQQIATLERELGVTLVDRTSRPVKPTAAGAAVLARADALLVQSDAIERELAALSRGEAGTLRMGGFFTAWATFLPAAVAAFSRTHPHVALELHQLEPDPAVRGVRAGELDLAVVYRAGPPDDDPAVQSTHLLDDPYVIALPSRHPLATRRELVLADLADERWVGPPSDHAHTQILRDLYREHGGFEPDVAYETRDIAMAQPIVAAGLAVALLPALALVPTHAGVVVRRLPSTPPARSVWTVRPSHRRMPIAVAMNEALAHAARQQDRASAA